MPHQGSAGRGRGSSGARDRPQWGGGGLPVLALSLGSVGYSQETPGLQTAHILFFLYTIGLCEERLGLARGAKRGRESPPSTVGRMRGERGASSLGKKQPSANAALHAARAPKQSRHPLSSSRRGTTNPISGLITFTVAGEGPPPTPALGHWPTPADLPIHPPPPQLKGSNRVERTRKRSQTPASQKHGLEARIRVSVRMSWALMVSPPPTQWLGARDGNSSFLNTQTRAYPRK